MHKMPLKTQKPGDFQTSTDASESKAKKRRNPFNESKEDKERRQKKRARLIVRNISYKTTEETLREHFAKWGKLEDVNLLKRADGKLVGCAFLQYETVNQAAKAILKANNQPMLGRPVFVDWAVSRNRYAALKQEQEEPSEKKPKVEEEHQVELDEDKSVKSEIDEDEDNDDDNSKDIKADGEDDDDAEEDDASEEDDDAEDDDDDAEDDDDDAEEHDDDAEDDDEDNDENKEKKKLGVDKIKKEKHISNDVQEGCTIFLKNVPFDAQDNDLRKVCRKYGLLWYAIINRDRISGHSKGTAFIKYKTKESADLCLQAGTDFVLMDQVLDPHPALSREEISAQKAQKDQQGDEGKDSRNLYLAREGLIMAGSKAAEDVSAGDMSKRHKLEQIKTQVLKNLNRFVSRNRLSIHNLPLSYDDEKLKQLAISYTSYRPHECRVMREHKITPEHPKGKSKGFGFLSFSTHKEALTALRKLNNNPKVFDPQHRPIVAFSIEDRAVHKIKEKRDERSKIKNPNYQEKLEKRKEQRQLKKSGKLSKPAQLTPQNDDKAKLKKHIKNLEETRAAKANGNSAVISEQPPTAEFDNYVGTAAKQGTSLRMRSNKKIKEQAQTHLKRVKANKRKEKQQKIRQTHLAERKADVRPKQGRKVERDDLKNLVNKYKRMIDSRANESGSSSLAAALSSNGSNNATKIKKPKRTKWYKD